MSSPLADALAKVRTAVDEVQALGVELAGVTDALAVARSVEAVARQVRSVQLQVIDAIDRGGLHRPDGHRSADAMACYAGRTSNAERRRRGQAVRALRDLPAVAAALRSGAIGACQVQRIAAVHANPRVRAQLVEVDEQVAAVASRVSYDELDRRLRNWEHEADEDGTCDRARRTHEDRDLRLFDEFDGGWAIVGRCGALDGAQLRDILSAFTDAELAADWDEARAVHGDATTVAHLARTDAQRRFDAFRRVCQLAAAARVHAGDGAAIETTIVMDADTFERGLARLAGATPAPRPAAAFDPDLQDPATVGYRCSTLDGVDIDPIQATVAALTGRARRAVIGAGSVTIDPGRRSRIFTGPAAYAVALSRPTCYWPGCTTPVTRCQSDHLLGWASGGRTDPGNGAPACGRHNRHKEHGFTVTRDQRGRLHILRPDGTPLE